MQQKFSGPAQPALVYYTIKENGRPHVFGTAAAAAYKDPANVFPLRSRLNQRFYLHYQQQRIERLTQTISYTVFVPNGTGFILKETGHGYNGYPGEIGKEIQVAGHLEPAARRHVEVQQDHIGAGLVHPFDDFLGMLDGNDIIFVQNERRTQFFEEFRIVVYNHYLFSGIIVHDRSLHKKHEARNTRFRLFLNIYPQIPKF